MSVGDLSGIYPGREVKRGRASTAICLYARRLTDNHWVGSVIDLGQQHLHRQPTMAWKNALPLR